MSIPYVDYGGTQMLRPPYVAKNVSFYAFLVHADTGALQKMLDNRLNLPSGGAVQFEPAGPFVVFAFNNLEKLSSMNPPDSGKGWFSEQECAVWVRVVDRKSERSMWFHPYIFVDNSYAMALGREVYGFPKAIGWFQIPDEPHQATSLFMETLTLPVYSPDTQGVRTRLISATQTAASGNPLKIVENALEFLGEAAGLLAAEAGSLGRIEVILNSLHDLIERNEPIVFLKQFPTAGVPGTACFQSIVEMTATATEVHGFCLVPGEWQIDIAPAASHPIASDLGLSGNSIKSALSLWVGFDMNVGLGEDVWIAPDAALTRAEPEKIAILGGGVGAMATALELTSNSDWKNRYDITIYQMGWRLGGKGASGRGEYDRIEEHGLHIWLGFYENAFRLMREVYEENKLNRPPSTPLRDWDDAFKTHNFVAVTDNAGPGGGAEWEVWPIHFPAADGTPGDGKHLTLWDMFLRLIGLIQEVYSESQFHRRGDQPASYHAILFGLQQCFGHLVLDLETLADITLLGHLEIALKICDSLDRDARKHSPLMHAELARLLDNFRNLLRDRIRPALTSGDAESRRLFQAVDLGISLAVGLLHGGYLANPAMLDTLEGDLQTWLKNQGADPITYDVRQSAIMRALYDLVFAYENGDAGRPSFEAGPAVRSMLLIVGGYKGAIFWKMQAGMGDVVFGPVYQVLKNRGVKFEFFHRVEGIGLKGTSIDEIRIGVQATLENLSKDYDPFVTCECLPSWPNAPRYEQLVEGEQLKAGAYNLESFWTTWKNPVEKTLRAGKDFDQVVLAISIGAIPYLFEDITALPVAFQRMLSNIQTVRTQAMELWVNQPLEKLGWTQGSVVLDAFSDPINTWAVMNQLIVRESWPAGTVQGIHYFCGQMFGGVPPKEDSGAPARGLSEVEANCDAFIGKDLPVLWPGMNPDFDIVSRFLRCNMDPSERYVLSVAGSTQYRLRANESGLSNAVLAGDWTNNGFNAGCVEAAVMSGIQAANAIEGNPLNQGIEGPLKSELQAARAAV